MKNIVIIFLVLLSSCEEPFVSSGFAKEPSAPIRAIIGEAGGEGYRGMLAVADAIRNRKTLKGVYGLRSYQVRHHLYSKYTLRLAKRAWLASRSIDITYGANFWEGTKFPLPYWATDMKETVVIGNQKFFRGAI